MEFEGILGALQVYVDYKEFCGRKIPYAAFQHIAETNFPVPVDIKDQNNLYQSEYLFESQ